MTEGKNPGRQAKQNQRGKKKGGRQAGRQARACLRAHSGPTQERPTPHRNAPHLHTERPPRPPPPAPRSPLLLPVGHRFGTSTGQVRSGQVKKQRPTIARPSVPPYVNTYICLSASCFLLHSTYQSPFAIGRDTPPIPMILSLSCHVLSENSSRGPRRSPRSLQQHRRGGAVIGPRSCQKQLRRA